MSPASYDRFQSAWKRALFNSIFAKLTGKDNRLPSLEEVSKLTKTINERYLGTQTIPIADIIGSEGRYSDFDKNFRPLNKALQARWAAIDDLYEKNQHVPPISVYKIDNYYFVRDGHHRVSVAKRRGQDYIDAEVMEYLVTVPITRELTPADKVMIQEHANFLELTQLTRLGPGYDIKLSIATAYQWLFKILQGYIDWRNSKQKEPLTLEEGVMEWYREVFLPFAEEAYLLDILSYFPNRTTGDLYVWIQLNWDYLRTKFRGEISYLRALEILRQKTTREVERNEFSLDDMAEVANSSLQLGKELPHKLYSIENRYIHQYIGLISTAVLLHMNREGELRVVVARRKYHPFENYWTLPVAVVRVNETRLESVKRVLAESLHFQEEIKLVHFETFDALNRTSFGRNLAFGFLGLYYGDALKISAGGMASEILSVPLNQVPDLVYDHNEIIHLACRYLFKIRNNFAFIKELFPDEIPLKEIRTLLRTIDQILHGEQPEK